MKREDKPLKTRFPVEKVAESILRQLVKARKELDTQPRTKQNRKLIEHLGILDALDINWKG